MREPDNAAPSTDTNRNWQMWKHFNKMNAMKAALEHKAG